MDYNEVAERLIKEERMLADLREEEITDEDQDGSEQDDEQDSNDDDNDEEGDEND